MRAWVTDSGDQPPFCVTVRLTVISQSRETLGAQPCGGDRFRFRFRFRCRCRFRFRVKRLACNFEVEGQGQGDVRVSKCHL